MRGLRENQYHLDEKQEWLGCFTHAIFVRFGLINFVHERDCHTCTSNWHQ